MLEWGIWASFGSEYMFELDLLSVNCPPIKHHNLDQSISYFYALLQLVAKDSFGSYASR
jgi:hypothetical protein